MNTNNPFSDDGGKTAWIDGDSRLYCVKNFSLEQCYAALEMRDLQKSVRLAVKRRIRKLSKAIR